jgi:type IV secretory pathway TraG/TraD family ATPase VirD4
MSSRPWHHYWLPVAFVGLILAPAPWATVGLLGAVAAVTAVRVARAIAARRARASAMRDAAVVLGRDPRGRPVALSDHELSAHGLILGASGAGKSTTLLRILTEQIHRGRPVVAVDMKGSPAFAQVLAEAAAAAGRPFACWSLDGPTGWNPLQHGNATELKDKLMATERFTEPHYQRAAERYVQTVLNVLSQVHPGRPPALAEVVELMNPHRLPSALRALPPDQRDRIRDYLDGMTHDQLSAVRGLQTRLAVLTESHVGPYLAPPAGGASGPVIDLREALHGPQVVLFSLNSSRYGHLAAQIGTLAVQDLVSASGDRLDHAVSAVDRAYIAIDEFSALGADHLIALLARGRESGLCVLVATQEMADLDRAAVGLREQVLGVTALKIVHRQEVPHSARTIAQIIGTKWVWDEIRQTVGGWFTGYDTGRGTRRQVERFIVDPNEIQSLRTGEAIVISKLRAVVGSLRVRVQPPRRVEPPPRVQPAPRVESPAPRIEPPAPQVEPPAPQVEPPAPRVEPPATIQPTRAARRSPRVEPPRRPSPAGPPRRPPPSDSRGR